MEWITKLATDSLNTRYTRRSTVVLRMCWLLQSKPTPAVRDLPPLTPVNLSLPSFYSNLLRIFYTCDWILENRSKSHIWCFKKYQFQIFTALYFSGA